MLFKNRLLLVCFVIFFYGATLVNAGEDNSVLFSESEMNTIFGEYKEQINFTYLNEQEMILTDGKALPAFVIHGIIGACIGMLEGAGTYFINGIAARELELKDFASSTLLGGVEGFVQGAIFGYAGFSTMTTVGGGIALGHIKMLTRTTDATCRNCHEF